MGFIRKLTGNLPKIDWDVIYQDNGKITLKRIGTNDENALDSKLSIFFQKKAHLLLVLKLRKKFLKKKPSAEIYRHGSIKNLSIRHNVHVLLRNSYANGETVAKDFDRTLKDADREEKIRTYRIADQHTDSWFVLKDIKGNVSAQPVLILFTSTTKNWDMIRESYVLPLVDFEGQIKVAEVHYDNQSQTKLGVQEAFTRFKVRRVPTWLMATPRKEKGHDGVRITRFETFRESYFAKQAQHGRNGMSLATMGDVREAFTAFIVWGLKQVQNYKPSAKVDL